MKLPKQLTGIAGEYFAAAELSRRGYLAAITLRNSDSIDILAKNLSTDKQISVQVKTSQNKRRWPLSAKAELSFDDNKMYIFINLKKINDRPEYFLIKSSELAQIITEGHKKWLSTLGRKGQVHNDTNFREFSDVSGKYLENWGILEEF